MSELAAHNHEMYVKEHTSGFKIRNYKVRFWLDSKGNQLYLATNEHTVCCVPNRLHQFTLFHDQNMENRDTLKPLLHQPQFVTKKGKQHFETLFYIIVLGAYNNDAECRIDVSVM